MELVASRQPANAQGLWGQPVALLDQRTNPNNNNVSTAATIRRMRLLARQFAHHPSVVMATTHALYQSGPSKRDIVCSIFYWIRSNITFTEDEELMYSTLGIPPQVDAELLIPPPLLLGMNPPTGDCDDYAMLGASMLLCAGIRPYFVTVAADDAEPWKFSHVYVCAELADERYAPNPARPAHMCLDAGNRLAMVPPGWEPDKIYRKALWNV